MSLHPKWPQDTADNTLRYLPPEVLARIYRLERENKTLKEINARLQERITLNGV